MTAVEYITLHRPDIEGWFEETDAWLFLALAGEADGGDLIEIGSYLGKSAILLGYLANAGEQVVVIDLFEGATPDEEQGAERSRWYGGLTQDRFLQNWRRFHAEDPAILQGLSHQMLATIESNSARFVHVDGSHAFTAVRGDISESIRVAAPDGLIVVDDVLSPHTPGVTAAAWEAVLQGRLVPLVQSERKLYGTPPGSSTTAEAIANCLRDIPVRAVETHEVAGYPVWEVRPIHPRRASVLRRGVGELIPSAGRRVFRAMRRGNS